MKYRITMEEMKEQLMYTLRQDEQNNAPLKFGQGLLLIENINSDGYIKLSFNYDVKYILNIYT